MDTFVSFKVSTVPLYLRTSAFYDTLNPADEDDISLPLRNFKPDTVVKSLADAHHLLFTLQFWGSEEVPPSLLDIFRLSTTDDILNLKDVFGEQFDTVNLLCAMNEPGSSRVNIALSKGILSLVKYFIDTGNPWDKWTACKYAAMSGNLPCLQFIHEQGGEINDAVCVAAARQNHFACFTYATENLLIRESFLCSLVAELGRLEMLVHLRANGYPWSTDVCRCAAENDHLDCLIYAHEHGCPWDTNTTTGAAASGHLRTLQYAHEHGCAWDYLTTKNAAYHGHLHCLVYAHEHGCAWNQLTPAHAALKGNMDCLRYAHEHGCVWNCMTIDMASERNNFEILKYAHARGCALTDNVYRWAARYGNLEMMRYTLANGVMLSVNVRNVAMEEASKHGHLDCLRFAHENYTTDCKSPNIPAECVCHAACNGHLACLQYAMNEGNGCGNAAICELAAGRGHLDCLVYLHEHNCALSAEVCYRAAAFGSLECLQYAILNNCQYGVQQLRIAAHQCRKPNNCREYIDRLHPPTAEPPVVAGLPEARPNKPCCIIC